MCISICLNCRIQRDVLLISFALNCEVWNALTSKLRPKQLIIYKSVVVKICSI